MHKVLSQLYFILFLRFVAKKNNFSVFVSSFLYLRVDFDQKVFSL